MCYPRIRKLCTRYLQIECKIYSFSEFVLARLGKARPGEKSGFAVGVPELKAHPHTLKQLFSHKKELNLVNVLVAASVSEDPGRRFGPDRNTTRF